MKYTNKYARNSMWGLLILVIAAGSSCKKESDTTSFDSASINAADGSLNQKYVNQETNIAGVTKTHTAIAVFQLINSTE